MFASSRREAMAGRRDSVDVSWWEKSKSPSWDRSDPTTRASASRGEVRKMDSIDPGDAFSPFD